MLLAQPGHDHPSCGKTDTEVNKRTSDRTKGIKRHLEENANWRHAGNYETYCDRRCANVELARSPVLFYGLFWEREDVWKTTDKQTAENDARSGRGTSKTSMTLALMRRFLFSCSNSEDFTF